MFKVRRDTKAPHGEPCYLEPWTTTCAARRTDLGEIITPEKGVADASI
jgi:hypothetical protein